GLPRTPAAGEHVQRLLPRRARGGGRSRHAAGGAVTFSNEPLLELRRGAVRDGALAALGALDARLPLDVPMLIGDEIARGEVIAPWNFPLAIAAGMTGAALAAGNAVILKPAEQTPACAKAVVDALHAAGIPHAALALLPGGDEPGKALVAHAGVHAIAFTGSCAA